MKKILALCLMICMTVIFLVSCGDDVRLDRGIYLANPDVALSSSIAIQDNNKCTIVLEEMGREVLHGTYTAEANQVTIRTNAGHLFIFLFADRTLTYVSDGSDNVGLADGTAFVYHAN